MERREEARMGDERPAFFIVCLRTLRYSERFSVHEWIKTILSKSTLAYFSSPRL